MLRLYHKLGCTLVVFPTFYAMSEPQVIEAVPFKDNIFITELMAHCSSMMDFQPGT
jgi:hypothetical protein